jgi:hypothetical protein
LKTPKTWTLPWSLVCRSHQCSPIPIAFPPPQQGSYSLAFWDEPRQNKGDEYVTNAPFKHPSSSGSGWDVKIQGFWFNFFSQWLIMNLRLGLTIMRSIVVPICYLLFMKLQIATHKIAFSTITCLSPMCVSPLVFRLACNLET